MGEKAGDFGNGVRPNESLSGVINCALAGNLIN